MWVLIKTAFIDKHASDPEDAEIPAGKKINVTADRGKELIDLGLAEAADEAHSTEQTETKEGDAAAR